MSGSTMVSTVSVQEYVEGLRSGNGGYSEEGLQKLNWCGQDLQGCDLSGLDLHGLDMTGANLRKADLSKAYLRGASLSEANLSGANLSAADLREADLSVVNLRAADLSEANLREADLWWANLSEANLRGVNLWGADLSEANLRAADLSGANLWGADLRRANLNGADLSEAKLREADLSEANLSDAILDWDEIPLVPNIDAAILEAIEAGGNLDMNRWHICKTTHGRAGWAVMLAGEEGQKLEEQLGTNVAASLIYAKSSPCGSRVPNWYASNEEALADIKDRAQKQLMASQSATPEEESMAIG